MDNPEITLYQIAKCQIMELHEEHRKYLIKITNRILERDMFSPTQF